MKHFNKAYQYFNKDLKQVEINIDKNLKKISKIAKKYKLFLVEDCCDALGAKYKMQKIGTFGDLATLSFYPAHHLTMGEGGGVFCNSSKLKRIVESLRDWGRDCWCDTGCDNTCKKRFGWKLGDLPFGYDHKYTYSHLGFNLKPLDKISISPVVVVDSAVVSLAYNS